MGISLFRYQTIQFGLKIAKMSKFKEVDNAFKKVNEAFEKFKSEGEPKQEIRAVRALLRVDNSNGCYHKEMIDFIPEQIWAEISRVIYNWKKEWVATTETHEEFKKSCDKLSGDDYENLYKSLFHEMRGSVKDEKYIPKQIYLETKDSFIFHENFITIESENGDKVEIEKGLLNRIKAKSLS